MNVVEVTATVLAALEVAPSEPADLTPLIRTPHGVQALLSGLRDGEVQQPLVDYMAASIDPSRIAHWTEVLHRDVLVGGVYRPVLAGSTDYPERLAAVWDAPPLLFVQGTLSERATPAVAIIGSRDAAESTTSATNDLAFALAGDGIDVVSGLAAGVDGAAHRGALAAGGRTTAVMGTGIQLVFPPQHDDLAAQIRKRGALVSEFPPYAPRTSTSFLRRNGTIAAMSDMLVVMDAATRSGSRQAVRRAVEYGRTVMIWESTLGAAPWARELADEGNGMFFSRPAQLLDQLHGATR